MTLPDRMHFAQGLGAALAAPKPAQRVSDLLRRVLTTEPDTWESEEQRLVRATSERMDVASGDTERLLLLARGIRHLLSEASSNHAVELLLELTVERERVMGVICKHAEGTIGRTSFLSFIGEQRWPDLLRRRVAALTMAELADLRTALEEVNVAQLEDLLIE